MSTGATIQLMDGRKKGPRLYLRHDGYPDTVQEAFKKKPNTALAAIVQVADLFEEVSVIGKKAYAPGYICFEFTYSLTTGKLTWPEMDEDDE